MLNIFLDIFLFIIISIYHTKITVSIYQIVLSSTSLQTFSADMGGREVADTTYTQTQLVGSSQLRGQGSHAR